MVCGGVIQTHAFSCLSLSPLGVLRKNEKKKVAHVHGYRAAVPFTIPVPILLSPTYLEEEGG